MRWLLNSLYGRIFALFWLTLALVVAAVLWLPKLDPRQQHDIPEKYLQRVANLSQELSTLIQDNSLSQRNLRRKFRNLEDQRHARFYLLDAQGNLKFNRHHRQPRPLRNFVSISDDLQAPKRKLYGDWQLSGPFLVQDKNQNYHLYIGQPSRKPPPFFLQILDRPLQFLLLTLAISTPFLLWLSWALSQPARRLQQAATRVAHGQFTPDPSLERGSREFAQTGHSFNQMVQSLAQMQQNQQRLLSNISHELRSPLTRLRMANAIAERKQGESKESTRIALEADRLEAMIAALLTLSREQLDDLHNRQSLVIDQLWLPILQDAQFEAEQRGKTLRYAELPQQYLLGHANQLMSALENVIRNAIKYAETSIDITMACDEKQLTITVSDDGPGVPNEQLQDIFRPFYRVSDARDRDSGGTGLGLAISAQAVHQHNGQIEAMENAQGGLSVRITLPFAACSPDIKQ
ncbi:Sensor histidine kinase CpxA [Vibrio stylophorae]|uniref:histidine kinase n=1 Tax=Vibrio stylophorae TaxID=659351 RepID=A0ABN8DXM1_9VIBR|nr:envelope stress sensor histidine kinase CpxA [Vibrio stylophorae]CAH0534580.1 Sensor histidine kinase CpxA [Vibrio stylophorae]